MSSLDGRLIDEATAGINAPDDGDQNAVARVDNAQAPDLPNLRYQALAAFVLEMAPLFANQSRALAETPPHSTVAASGGTCAVDLPLTLGYLHECLITAVSENGSGAVLFHEVRRVMVAYPSAGSPTVLDSSVVYSNSAASWSFAASISGTNLRATLTNNTGTTRGCDVFVGVSRSRAIPLPP